MNSVYLPDDIFYYLMNYLDQVDCVSLSVSGIWPRFTYLYQQKRELNLEECYNTAPSTFLSFFKGFSSPERVVVLNLNHCYWVPTKVLLRAVTMFPHIEELYIEDTRLNFNHLQKIFKNCQKITHLSFTLKLPDGKKSNGSMMNVENISGLLSCKDSFKQLNHLKIIWHDSEVLCCLIVIELLSWCFSCTNLHLEPYFDMETPNERELEIAHTHLFPKLRWMENLRNLICYHTEVRQRDATMFDFLFQWIATELQFKQIERFWYGTGKNLNIQPPSSIKSWQFGHKMPSYSIEKFTEINEIGGIKISKLPRLPQLKLVDGSFSSYQVLFKFLKQQPMLEHVFIKPSKKWKSRPYEGILPNHFQLTCLTTLTYVCGFLDADVVAKLISISPNLENVSITANEIDLNNQPLDEVSKLRRLRKLSLLSDFTGSASVIEKILTNCTQLERLYIWGKHVNKGPEFINGLCNSLPLANNLRELSITWEEDVCLCRFKRILSAAEQCERVKRLHLDLLGVDATDKEESAKLADFVAGCVHRMKNLVALSLHLRECSAYVQKKMKKQIKRTIVPGRPSFWFCLDIYSSKICVHNNVVCDSRTPCAYLSK